MRIAPKVSGREVVTGLGDSEDQLPHRDEHDAGVEKLSRVSATPRPHRSPDAWMSASGRGTVTGLATSSLPT